MNKLFDRNRRYIGCGLGLTFLILLWAAPHLTISLFYLLLVAILFFGYTCFFGILFRYFRGLAVKIIKKKWSRRMALPGRDILFSHSQIKIILIFCFLITAGIYTYERNQWITEKSAYPKAKNYFVTGIVLRDIRALTLRIAQPHRMIWRPLDWLQEAILHTGRRLIPENDGEHGIWEYHLFLSTYTARIYAPKTKFALTLNRRARFIVENLAVKPMKDKAFGEKHRFLAYPYAALMYEHTSLRKYNIKYGYDRFDKFYKDPRQYREIKQVAEWTIQVDQEGKKQAGVQEFMKKNPDTALIQQLATILLLHQILYYQIHNLEFNCQDRYLNLYWEYVLNSASDDSPYHWANDNLRKTFRHLALFNGDRISLFGHKLCGLQRLPGGYLRYAKNLSAEGPGWYDSFKELNKRLVPEHKQKEVLERLDPIDSTWKEFFNMKRKEK